MAGQCPHGDGKHHFEQESDGAWVCQKCGDVYEDRRKPRKAEGAV